MKNYWNTKLRKKLSEMGIDPVTHKPFSQILADYGNIGGLPKSGNRIGSLNRDMKNAFMPKAEQHHLPPFQFFSNINSHLKTTMVSPKVETIQDNSNSSMDLLTQLQAIKLVTEASNCANNNHDAVSPQFYNEGSFPSSSSSSSSSTCSTAGQEKLPPNFSWQDFLLEDAFLSTDPPEQEQDNNTVEFSSKEFTQGTENYMIPQNQNHKEIPAQRMDIGGSSYNEFGASSSTNSTSFVEAMLDRENETFLEFPNLLEEPFYN